MNKTRTVGYSTIRPIRLLDENYAWTDLTRAILRKIRRRILGRLEKIEPVANLGGFVFFDRKDLDGGGLIFGQDFLRLLKDLRLPRCNRLFEFCAGPGYIGYLLLHYGFCEHLVLADVNPDALEAAQKTAKFNGVDQSVTTYTSDALKHIPPSERFDIVVGNPPHFEHWDGEDKLLCEDAGWAVHRKFYSEIKNFLTPGSCVILQECCEGSTREVFEPMIASGGGRLVETRLGPVFPDGYSYYYVVSIW